MDILINQTVKEKIRIRGPQIGDIIIGQSLCNYTSMLKNEEFSTRVGTIVDRKKVLKQAGVVRNIKSQ